MKEAVTEVNAFLQNCITTKAGQCQTDISNAIPILTDMANKLDILHISSLSGDATQLESIFSDFDANCVSNSSDCQNLQNQIQSQVSDIPTKFSHFDMKGIKSDID